MINAHNTHEGHFQNVEIKDANGGGDQIQNNEQNMNDNKASRKIYQKISQSEKSSHYPSSEYVFTFDFNSVRISEQNYNGYYLNQTKTLFKVWVPNWNLKSEF